MNILVTGADGFIGSRLTEMLIQRGHSVTALVLYNQFNSLGWLDDAAEDVVSRLKVVQGDVRDVQTLQLAMDRVDAVIHLAALIAIPYSYIAPQSYIDTNVLGTLNLLNSALKNNVNRFIHTSTSEVYGSAQYIPIDENHPLVGQSPYSASKIAADQLAISFNKSFNLPVSIVRPFNTFGPRQSSRAIIPSIISQVLLNNKSINLGYIDSTRDFNYVTDIVEAFYQTSKSSKAIGEVINFGSGYEISIKELSQLIMKIIGKKLVVKTEIKRFRPKDSEVQRLNANASKAKKLTKWKPKFVGKKGFKNALENTINWFSKKENINFYDNKYII